MESLIIESVVKGFDIIVFKNLVRWSYTIKDKAKNKKLQTKSLQFGVYMVLYFYDRKWYDEKK